MGISRSAQLVVGFANDVNTFLGDRREEWLASGEETPEFVQSKIEGYKHQLYADVLGDFWSGTVYMTVSLRKPEVIRDSESGIIKLDELESIKEKIEELGVYLRSLGFEPGEPGIHHILNVC